MNKNVFTIIDGLLCPRLYYPMRFFVVVVLYFLVTTKITFGQKKKKSVTMSKICYRRGCTVRSLLFLPVCVYGFCESVCTYMPLYVCVMYACLFVPFNISTSNWPFWDLKDIQLRHD